jgi:hypothetical protein
VVDTDEAAESLRRLRDHMLPGARLAGEIETPAAVPRGIGRWGGRWWTRPDGARIVLRTIGNYDEAKRVTTALGIYELYVDRRLIETEVDEFVVRYWEAGEFTALLERMGFVEIGVTKAFTDSSPDGTEAMLSFVCTNPS